MTAAIAYGIGGASLLVAGWAGWLTVRDHRVGNPLFYAVSVVEIALIAQLVGGCVALAKTDRDIDGITFVSYLVTVVVVPPAAVLWGIAEKTRWGVGVLAVGMLTVAALCLRILDIWVGHYA